MTPFIAAGLYQDILDEVKDEVEIKIKNTEKEESGDEIKRKLIESIVCITYHIPVSNLTAKKRLLKNHMNPKKTCIYLVAMYTDYKPKEIMPLYGLKRANYYNSIKKAKNYFETDPRFRLRMEKAIRMVEMNFAKREIEYTKKEI